MRARVEVVFAGATPRSEMTVLVVTGSSYTEVNGGEEGAAKQVMDRIDLKGLAKETGS